MEPVNAKVARGCVVEFDAVMKRAGITTPAKGLTTSVGFNSAELLLWMNKVAPHMHELRVVFGAYTSELAPAKVGRLTVFLWPYNKEGEPAKDDDGEEIDPVNVGDLLP